MAVLLPAETMTGVSMSTLTRKIHIAPWYQWILSRIAYHGRAFSVTDGRQNLPT